MNKQIYDGFDDWVAMMACFNEDKTTPMPEYVYAVYDTPPYEGYATVVYRDTTGWHLVTGSHCSCMGLENQWDPESFNPEMHFAALQEGKRLITMGYGWEPDAKVNEAFDAWLKEATS